MEVIVQKRWNGSDPDRIRVKIRNRTGRLWSSRTEAFTRRGAGRSTGCRSSPVAVTTATSSASSARCQELMRGSSKLPLFDLKKLNASLSVPSMPKNSVLLCAFCSVPLQRPMQITSNRDSCKARKEFVKCPNSLKPSLPFIEVEQSLDVLSRLDVMSHFDELSGNVVMEDPNFDELSGNVVMEDPNLGFMGYSNENFLPFLENFLGLLPGEYPKLAMSSTPVTSTENKRKAEASSESNCVSSSATPSETKKKNSSGSEKRGRSNSKEVEKPKEVVHVRARRGHATDSHSLAERVRREKINERMRFLQDLVPGCYKTMGMAGMLDEIINYVQSLQNQVEFLSMKLSAASSFYDFNLDMETTTPQQVLPRGVDAHQAQEMERLMREGYGGCTSFQSTMPL